MHANDIRILYDYHFAINRKVWEAAIVPLSEEKFLQPLGYSVGSIRNQMVHLMDIEEGWFGGLRSGVPGRGAFKNPQDWATREQIRAHWDTVEADMKVYLQHLTDEVCNQPFEQKSESIKNWQVMMHVLNHATDHRGQILAMLHSLGAQTFAQDMIFHFWGVS
jgi:uncharacterized damage-inducible protein DinB